VPTPTSLIPGTRLQIDPQIPLIKAWAAPRAQSGRPPLGPRPRCAGPATTTTTSLGEA